uniref:Uncharacterized protein n=1 Tax=Anguilla anguilla TaxID=7936 RepID=A0A0E9XCA8_ANGAN
MFSMLTCCFWTKAADLVPSRTFCFCFFVQFILMLTLHP